ncbi:MAG: hypothetical protein ABI180_17615 [Microcoleus sp.]
MARIRDPLISKIAYKPLSLSVLAESRSPVPDPLGVERKILDQNSSSEIHLRSKSKISNRLTRFHGSEPLPAASVLPIAIARNYSYNLKI